MMNKLAVSHPIAAVTRSIMVFVVLIALGVSVHAQSVRAQKSVTITQPSSPVTLTEDLDYMTYNWHDAWDMNEEQDVYLFASPTCNGVPNMFSNNSFSNGVWSSSFAVVNPYFWLLHPGYLSALHVGKDGNVHLIDADTYTQLTLRMYLSPGFDPSQKPGAVLTWTTGDVSSLSDPDKHGKPYFFRVFPGWNIYTIDLAQSTLQAGNLPWRGKISGLQLSPAFLLPAGTNMKIDWVRLTPKPTRTVAWSGSWQGSASANLLFSTDGSTYDPLMIYTDNQVAPHLAILAPDVIPAGSNGTSGSYNVPASFPPGPVYIKVQIEGTTSAPAGPWQFNARPSVMITAPSYTSGEEFSANVVGNAWDMSSAPDIASYKKLTSAPTYANGCAIATNTPVSTDCKTSWSDVALLLNMNGKSVDTNYYRYFTVRLKVNAPFDFGNGWISRLIWIKDNQYGVSNDMPLYTGWNIFQVDLWGNIQEDDGSPAGPPWRSISPTILRFDPIEIPPSTQFEIDYVKLTAVNEADFTYDIRWEVYDPDSEDISLNIYYSSTAQSATDALTGDKTLIARIQPNGQVIRSPKSSPMPDSSGQTGDYMVYLPMVNRNYIELPPCEDGCFRWDTSSVPEGAYYIHVEADDGHNTTHWRSEVPVVIKH